MSKNHKQDYRYTQKDTNLKLLISNYKSEAVMSSCSCQPCKEKAIVLSICCRESFCEKCIDKIIQGKRPCPKCGGRVQGYLKEQLGKSEIEIVIDSTAGLGRVRKIIDDHQEVCKPGEVKCELCEQVVSKNEMKRHLDHDCPEKVVPCPKKCGFCFTRNDIDSHTKECGKLSSMVADLKTKQEQQQRSIDQLTRINNRGDKPKEQTDADSRLEALLQELKQQLIRQETKVTEQQQIIIKLERELQEQKEALARLPHEHLKDGAEGEEHFIDQVMRVIRSKIKEERFTLCWAGILVALPSVSIAVYETCN